MTLAVAKRDAAAAMIAARGVPHRRIEEWKYSDLKSALGEAGLGAVVAVSVTTPRARMRPSAYETTSSPGLARRMLL